MPESENARRIGRIVLHGAVTPGFTANLSALAVPGQIAFVAADDHRALLHALSDCEILLHVLQPLSAEDIAAAPRLKLIQKIGVGVNTIAVDAAAARGVAVCNMPGSNSGAVAEHALTLMLAVLRRLPVYDRLLRKGHWLPPDIALGDSVGEVAGRTIGLVGYGRSAQSLAPVLRALGGKVIYTATAPHAGVEDSFRAIDDLMAEADIVSLHLPLTKKTQSLIDARRIARMKPGAILVNVARGGLIEEPALIEALRSGHLRGAGLDAFADEPVARDNPLLALPNVVVTPHIAWLTAETLDRSLTIIAENIRRLDAGEPLLHRVA
jgi:phosphoglycerate dehydrogenase-like enzyme